MNVGPEQADRGERPESGDQDVAGLLRRAGARAAPAADRERRVKAAVIREWQTAVAARRRRRVTTAVLLAAAATALLAVWVGRPDGGAPARAAFGRIERVQGDPVRARGTEEPLTVDATLWIGDDVETNGAARLGLRHASGLSLRLDHDTRVRLMAHDTVLLITGAIYVDSEAGTAPIAIETALATVRDVGTQFEVRLGERTLSVRVRSGLVEVVRGQDIEPARPGTELTVGPAGVSRRTIQPFGDEWSWVTTVGPAFDTEGRPLSTFLEHLCREQGWTLSWADRRLPLDASGIILHGSLAGTTPEEQLTIALSASGLGYRLVNGELVVYRPGAP